MVMMNPSIVSSLLLLLLLLAVFGKEVHASSYHVTLISPAIPSFGQRVSRGRRFHSHSNKNRPHNQQQQQSRQVLLVANKKEVINQETPQYTTQITAPSKEDVPRWEDLPLGWKAVFGTIEVAYTVATQYLSGFATAYVLGSLTGIPGFAKVPTAGLTRLSRFHQRNMRWGRNWGQISASFSGFDTGVRLLRNNRQDEWNSLFGSACAGAFFVRSQGPGSMAKSAMLYAAFGYFFMRAGRSNQVFVEEQPL